MRYFLIFDKLLSWLNDDPKMSETCTSNNMSSSTTPRFLALAMVVSLSCITHTEGDEKWTSMVLRVHKHNFCLVVIEFQLVYVHPMT